MTQTEIVQVKTNVRKRDGYRCVRCGMTNRTHIRKHRRQLHVHRRIRGSRYNESGCETLCLGCHVEAHRDDPRPVVKPRNKKLILSERIGFVVPASWLERAEAKAISMGLALSAYIRMVVENDLKEDDHD